MRNFILFIILNLLQVPSPIYAQDNTIDSTEIVIKDSTTNISSDTTNMQKRVIPIFF